MSYYTRKYFSTDVTTATAGVVIGTIDISHLDKFCLVYQNYNSSVACIHLDVQASVIPSAGSTAPSWFSLNSALVPSPSALGASAIISTTPINNVYKNLRVIAGMSATASAGTLSVTVAGFSRF